MAIFDLDGTLIDSKLDLAHSVNAARAHLNLDALPHELIYSYVGNGAPVLIRRALGDDAAEADVERALAFFLAYYNEHRLDYTTLYPGASQALESLHQDGVRMAVLTNKPVNISRLILEGLGVAHLFFRIYGGNSFDRKKPDPVGIHALMTEAGVGAERTLMIGDSGVDMQTARNARVFAVGCTWGFQPESLAANPPDWRIESMGELPAIVRSAGVLAPNAIM